MIIILLLKGYIIYLNNYFKFDSYKINSNYNLEKIQSNSSYTVTINPHYSNEINNYKSKINAVIGLLAVYNYTVVEPFFKSLRNSGYDGEIICFTLEKSLILYVGIFTKYNIKPIIFSKTYPYYLSGNKNYPLSKELLKKMPFIPQDFFFYANVRFFLLYMWLDEYSSKFDYILTCDLKDSLFQKNPFEWNYKKGVYLSHETQRCKYYESKKCNLANYNWFFNLNPPKHLLNNTFINAGQIFGSSVEMKVFMKEYTEMMYNIHLKNKRRVDTCDQGILNWYVYTTTVFHFPLYLFEAEYGYVRILGLDLSRYRNDFYPNDNYTITNKDGTIPVIVHQYYVGMIYGTAERKKKYNELYRKYVNK